MPIQPMEFLKYDKVSDDVYVLGSNAVLKFNVSLSKTTSEGKRYHFYKEFEYKARTREFDTLVTIKRSFDYYLSIENIQKDKLTDTKAFIRIGPSDYFKLKSQLEQVYEWFTGKKYKGLFASNRGRIVLTNPVPESTLGGYPQNKFLRFIPTVIDKSEGNSSMQPGVEMSLSDYNNYVVMTVDKFMGFYYTVMNFNMYLAAQNMVGYLGFHGGVNRIGIGNDTSPHIISGEEFVGEVDGVNDRVIGNRKNISSLE